MEYLATSKILSLNRKVKTTFVKMSQQINSGKAAKSASGAAMSKYDVEVEARLKALEKNAHEKCDGGGAGITPELAAKIEEMYDWFQYAKHEI
jgi:hypothetical protein